MTSSHRKSTWPAGISTLNLAFRKKKKKNLGTSGEMERERAGKSGGKEQIFRMVEVRERLIELVKSRQG